MIVTIAAVAPGGTAIDSALALSLPLAEADRCASRRPANFVAGAVRESYARSGVGRKCGEPAGCRAARELAAERASGEVGVVHVDVEARRVGDDRVGTWPPSAPRSASAEGVGCRARRSRPRPARRRRPRRVWMWASVGARSRCTTCPSRPRSRWRRRRRTTRLRRRRRRCRRVVGDLVRTLQLGDVRASRRPGRRQAAVGAAGVADGDGRDDDGAGNGRRPRRHPGWFASCCSDQVVRTVGGAAPDHGPQTCPAARRLPSDCRIGHRRVSSEPATDASGAAATPIGQPEQLGQCVDGRQAASARVAAPAGDQQRAVDAGGREPHRAVRPSARSITTPWRPPASLRVAEVTESPNDSTCRNVSGAARHGLVDAEAARHVGVGGPVEHGRGRGVGDDPRDRIVVRPSRPSLSRRRSRARSGMFSCQRCVVPAEVVTRSNTTSTSGSRYTHSRCTQLHRRAAFAVYTAVESAATCSQPDALVQRLHRRAGALALGDGVAAAVDDPHEVVQLLLLADARVREEVRIGRHPAVAVQQERALVAVGVRLGVRPDRDVQPRGRRRPVGPGVELADARSRGTRCSAPDSGCTGTVVMS